MIKITDQEFKQIAGYIAEKSGILLGPGKEYLIETRLSAILEEYGCQSYDTFLRRLRTADPGRDLEKRLVDAISTNETFFFRDPATFDLLQHKIIPDLIDRRTAEQNGRLPIPIRIWSAATSTGQEIYSIAMVLKELGLSQTKYRIRLLGTDISNAAIAQASYGRYNQFEIGRGLSPARQDRYFQKQGNSWRIKDDLRAMVAFKQMNLMEPFTGLGRFDIIFCRNVAIYFSPESRRQLYDKIGRVLEADGYLLLGATESLAYESLQFEPKRYLKSVFYQLRQGGSAGR